MANIFPFTKSKSVVAEDGVEWTNEIVTQNSSPLNFSTSNISIADSFNESYATAVGNDTHYLSVLESTNDGTLQDIHNLTLTNQIQDNVDREVENENNLTLTESGEQVVIFNVEGSDDIYGIQLAQDEEGNVHRYQFQFRKTEDGQLEAMPETVQLLPNEEEQETLIEPPKEFVVNEENQITEEMFETQVYFHKNINQSETNTQLILSEPEENVYEEQEDVPPGVDSDAIMVFIKGEEVATEEREKKEQILDEHYEEAIIDQKPGLKQLKIKDEILSDKKYNEENQDTDFEPNEEIILENLAEDCTPSAESYAEIENGKTIITYQDFAGQNLEDYEDTETLNSDPNSVDEEHYEELFIEENHVNEFHYEQEVEQNVLEMHEETANVIIVQKQPEIQVSDNEDYETVEELSVRVDGEITENITAATYSEPQILNAQQNITETMQIREKTIQKTTNILKQPTNNKANDAKKKTILYYMVSDTDQKENLNSLSNPRSLLKNNIEKIDNDEHIKREKLLERRYARSKEAMQAKMFNNFINKTTIPHAPVRQKRLPRKQEIKPVDNRSDEEIIVKEVMVSSKGFVESVSERLKSLEVTSIVELSDSDEDYVPKNGTNMRKKYRKTKPINEGASNDSDGSVIEILQSDEELENKNQVRENPLRSGDESSPSKKSRTESSDVESDNEKKEIICPHCPKTFPSQNSLTTHIQHHNLENSLRKTKKNLVFENRHICNICQESFKNSILLKRHVCKSDPNLFKHKCGVCSKSFTDLVSFNNHKRSHKKENLAKSTNTVTVSPKKLSRPSTTTFKVPSSMQPSFKCKECSKVCSTQNLLSIHEKSHIKFICKNCQISFSSKLLLDTHVRLKCVKTSSPKNRRLSLKIRRSFVSSPRRTIGTRKSILPVKSNNKSLTSSANLGCTMNIPTTTNSNKNSLKSDLRSSIAPKNINRGLNTSSMIRTLDVDAECDSCPMKFKNLTSLFKHKVKEHGLSTPDKKVLESEKKLLYNPPKDQSGFRPNARVAKAFQEVRLKLLEAPGISKQ